MERLDITHEVVRVYQERDYKPQLTSVETLQKPERMPLTVRIAGDENDLEQAVNMRRAAYGRHLPEFARKMSAEDCDRSPGTTVLLAESKFDRAPLGTMRIQTNEFAPLPVQSSVQLPPWCGSGRLAAATGLGVAGG